MHLLITRPGDDGTRLAEAVRQIGHEPILEPLLTIRFLDGPPLDLSGVQAILATSANGVRAIVGRTDRRDIPLYAVGDATARTAREAGFSDVLSASGDVGALASLAKEKLDPAKGPLVHVAGTEVAGDLAGQLAATGFLIRREVLYESEAANSLSPSAIAAIKEERVDAILLYSPRTAETLSRLIRKARLVRDCRRIELLCLSQAVADAAHDIQWAGTRLASEPTQEAMLALARDLKDSPSASVAPEPGSAPPPPPPPPKSHIGAAVLAILVIVLAVAGIGWATQPYWRPYAARYLPVLAAAEVAAPRLDEIEKRLSLLESQTRAASPVPAPAPDAALVARIEKLESAIETLRATTAQSAQGGESDTVRQMNERLAIVSADTAARLDRLARHIDSLEQSAPSRDDAETVRHARIVFAIGRLRDAVLSTHAFRIELAALKSLAGDDPAIAQALARLAPYADGGVPTAEILRQRFRSLAGPIVAAAHEPAGESWLDRSLARIMGAVNIRRIDDVEGATSDAVVARAERALARGDIEQAARELATLDEPAAPLVKQWLADADAYLAASGALVDLQTRAFAELGIKQGK